MANQQQGAPKLEVDAAGLDSFHAWYSTLPEVRKHSGLRPTPDYLSILLLTSNQFQTSCLAGPPLCPFLRPENMLFRAWRTGIHGSSPPVPQHGASDLHWRP